MLPVLAGTEAKGKKAFQEETTSTPT